MDMADCVVSNSVFLNRLSQQILHVHHEHSKSKVPHVKICAHERRICNSYRNRKPSITSIVKAEVDGDSIASNEQEIDYCLDDNSSNRGHDKLCLLCMNSTATNSCHQHTSTLILGDEDEFLREIFQTSSHEPLLLNFTEELLFCEQCLRYVQNLRDCYLKFKNAQKEYLESLLRLRCFKKWAQQVGSSSSKLAEEIHENSNPFEESLSTELVDVKGDTAEGFQSPAKGENIPIRRRGAPETKNNSKSLLTRKISPVSSVSSLFPDISDDSHFEDILEQDPITCDQRKHEESMLEIITGPSSTLGSLEQTRNITRKEKARKNKKYDYKGKAIRRRGGITEEQYQEHRRAQSARYYFEKRRKLGKLTFGPKPLSVSARAKLDKTEQICLDSNKLPARSSCGIPVPVGTFEGGKRFCYRNVEFTKDEEGMHYCGKCGHTAKVLNVMKKHIAKIHFDKEHGYKCSQCDKSFYYQFQLKSHEGRHTEKGAGIQCEECGQSFKYSAGYFHHRRTIHQGIRPHECQLCQKQFGTKKDLRKHQESKSHIARANPTNNTTDVGKPSKEYSVFY